MEFGDKSNQIKKCRHHFQTELNMGTAVVIILNSNSAYYASDVEFESINKMFIHHHIFLKRGTLIPGGLIRLHKKIISIEIFVLGKIKGDYRKLIINKIYFVLFLK